jgi:hypothetical protein
LLDSGGDPAPNSGEGEANVEEGVARNDQWWEERVVLCRKRREEGGLYSLLEHLREVTGDER